MNEILSQWNVSPEYPKRSGKSEINLDVESRHALNF